MLSQDAQNLAKSIKEIEAKATQMAHVLNCFSQHPQKFERKSCIHRKSRTCQSAVRKACL